MSDPPPPTFTTSPPPADLHPMCDVELDRLMEELESPAKFDKVPSATKRAIRAFVRRKFDEEVEKINKGFAAQTEYFSTLTDRREKRLDDLKAERDAAREVVREMTHCMRLPEKGDGFTRFVVPTNEFNDWRKRVGLEIDAEGYDARPIFQGAPSVGVPLQSPLTGHATGCTPDHCVPACPNPRGNR